MEVLLYRMVPCVAEHLQSWAEEFFREYRFTEEQYELLLNALMVSSCGELDLSGMCGIDFAGETGVH